MLEKRFDEVLLVEGRFEFLFVAQVHETEEDVLEEKLVEVLLVGGNQLQKDLLVPDLLPDDGIFEQEGQGF